MTDTTKKVLLVLVIIALVVSAIGTYLVVSNVSSVAQQGPDVSAQSAQVKLVVAEKAQPVEETAKVKLEVT